MVFIRKGIILSAIFLCFQIKSYEVTPDFERGLFWNSFPIKMRRYVLESAQINELRDATEAAVADWESHVGRDIWEFVSDVEVKSGDAIENNIRWSDNFGDETGYDPTRTLAVAIRYNDGMIYSKTEIILNGNYSNLRNNVGGMLLNTILHELGHTIGLDHTEEHAIMAAYANDLRVLQADDVDGGHYVYDVHLDRQEIGGIQMLSGSDRDSNRDFGACGSVDINSSGGGNSDYKFMFSIMVGLLTVILGNYGMAGRFFREGQTA